MRSPNNGGRHPPRRKDFSDVQELMQIRQFSDRSGALSQAAVPDDVHLLAVMDHSQARIFETEVHRPAPERVTPYDPHGSRRHLRFVEDGDANGPRKTELKAFYEAVARTLGGAERVLIVASATGAGSAMAHLAAELERNHPELARRVGETFVVDARHMSDDQLLAKGPRPLRDQTPPGDARLARRMVTCHRGCGSPSADRWPNSSQETPTFLRNPV